MTALVESYSRLIFRRLSALFLAAGIVLLGLEFSRAQAAGAHFVDAPGHSIYDAWVIGESWGFGGLDLEAVGVMNEVEESGSPVQSILRLNSKTPAVVPARTVPDGVQKTPDGRLFL